MPGPKKQIYRWADFDRDCRKIARWAQRQKFKNMYGIPRGGLVVAVRLSHFAHIPVILDYRKISRSTLVVDDISDSGKTLSRLRRLIKIVPRVATLFWHEKSAEPNFWCRKKTSWVIFPWETVGTSRYDKTDY